MDREQDPAQPLRRMPRLAHLVNVFVPQKGSEFEYVQPITLASMQHAQARAAEAGIHVQLLTAQFPEDHAAVPPAWQATEDLDRSVRDVYGDASHPPEPLLAAQLGGIEAEAEPD